MTLVGTAARRYRFGRFLLDPDRRLLTADGAPVAVGSRAFDILQLLIERRDQVVSRDDILACVWRGTVVEGNTLAVQISALRRALGETQMIATVPGRGYRFVGSVQDEAADVPVPMPVPRVFEGAADTPVPSPHTVMPIRARPRPTWLAWAAPAALVVAAMLALTFRHAWQTQTAPRLSIVVLPFRNLGGDVQQEYLADAISDDLTTDLSHIPGSLVIARASADTYKGRAVAADTIGRALNVRYLLEGSLRAEGDKLHINAQLIDAPTGMHLWADAFDTSRDKLGHARSGIVRRIASALHVTLVDIEGERSLHERATNPDAMDFFLRARSVLDHSYSLTSLTEAQGLLEQSVALAPQYAEAMAKLGIVLLHKITDFDDPDELKDYEHAQILINDAVNLAPQSAAAISAKGELSLVDHRCDQAEASFRLALSFDPDNLSARRGLGQCARMLGQIDEMISVLQEAMQIEPVGPQNAANQHFIGMGMLFLGKPEEAIRWFERAGAGISPSETDETALGWQEWRVIYLIAATQMIGDTNRAHLLYHEYSKDRPYRTVWQLASYGTRAQANLPAYSTYLKALQSAGMPYYISEDADYHVSATPTQQNHGDFDPTPLSLPGATLINTQKLRSMLLAQEKPLILDFGRGSAVISGAKWSRSARIVPNADQVLDQVIGNGQPSDDRSIVVMSNGPLGWESYNAAIRLVARSIGHVFWYRGGEQAWSAAGLPAMDLRTP